MSDKQTILKKEEPKPADSKKPILPAEEELVSSLNTIL